MIVNYSIFLINNFNRYILLNVLFPSILSQNFMFVSKLMTGQSLKISYFQTKIGHNCIIFIATIESIGIPFIELLNN